MAQQTQEYELKMAVMNHQSLKTTQLIEYLENQCNQFLTQVIPDTIPQNHSQKFMANFEHLSKIITAEDYVGFLVIYNAASLDSFNYANQCITKLTQQPSELFKILVEMQAGDKKVNVVGDKGYNLSKKYEISFVKLTIENSQDLVNQINKSLYELIENYYYPNEQLQQPNKHKKQDQQQKQYVFEYNQPTIIATKSQREKMESLLEKASKLRQSRFQQMVEQQQNIDQSIQNVQKVLNNLNKHIGHKMQSGWFSKLKQSLYAPCQKVSNQFAKIKLTQQFLPDNNNSFKKTGFSTLQKSTQNKLLTIANLKSNNEPILRIVFLIQNHKVVEFDLYENSNIDELGIKVLTQLGLKLSDKNITTIKLKIQQKIQTFVKETQKAIRAQQRKRIRQRSFL